MLVIGGRLCLFWPLMNKIHTGSSFNSDLGNLSLSGCQIRILSEKTAFLRSEVNMDAPAASTGGEGRSYSVINITYFYAFDLLINWNSDWW